MQPKPTFDFDSLDADVDRNPYDFVRVKSAIETDIDVDAPGMRERMGVCVQRLVRRRGGFALSIYNDRFDFAMTLLNRGIALPPPAWRELAETPIRMNDTLGVLAVMGTLGFTPAETIPLGLALFHHGYLEDDQGAAIAQLQNILSAFFSRGVSVDLTDKVGRGFLVHAASCFTDTTLLADLLDRGVDAEFRCSAGKSIDDWINEFSRGNMNDKRLRVIHSWRAKSAMQSIIDKARVKQGKAG